MNTPSVQILECHCNPKGGADNQLRRLKRESKVLNSWDNEEDIMGISMSRRSCQTSSSGCKVSWSWVFPG
jgi:hypothetical protein